MKSVRTVPKASSPSPAGPDERETSSVGYSPVRGIPESGKRPSGQAGRTSTADRARVVRTLLAAIDAGDQGTADSLIADDVCFRFGSNPPVTSKREFVAGRRALRGSILGFRHEIDTDAVVVAMNVTYTRRDGSEVTIPCCDTFRLRDGLIVDYRIYIDISPVLNQD
jgi:ketosteroid isomerase-like protein